MRGAILGLVACTLLLITACGQQMAGAAGDDQLDPKIPPADRDKYKSVRDAKDWANPYLVIRADGVELIAKAVPAGRKVVAVRDLQKSLLDLPVSAWPYGKVVAVQEIGIRSGNDDERIKQNKAKVGQALKSLGVTIELWPSG